MKHKILLLFALFALSSVVVKAGNITFSPIPAKTYGDPVFNLVGSHSLGKTIYFVSDNPSVISVNKVGSIWQATIHKASSVILRAKFDGDAIGTPAEDLPQEVTIDKALLTITALNVNMVYGTDPSTINLLGKYSITGFAYGETESVLSTPPTVNIDPSITSSSPVMAYPGRVKVSGITAENYKIYHVNGVLIINKAPQIINFPNFGTVTVDDADFNAGVTVNSGLPLTYYSGDPSIASIAADGTITVHKVGTVAITASQAGDENYLSASESRTLNIVSEVGAGILTIHINSEFIPIAPVMHYDMGASIVTNLNIEIETEIGATVNTGHSFVEIIDKPMIRNIDIIVTAPNGSTENYTLIIEKRFAFDKIVITRWNNTLTVIKNPSVTSGYNLKTYKWFRNGVEIAQGQSYYTGSKDDLLSITDKYYVEVTSDDFVGTLRTTEGAPDIKSLAIRAYPNPVNSGETVYVEVDIEDLLLKSAVIHIYNIMGMYIGKVAVEGKLTPVSLPSAGSSYIFKLSGENGLSKDLKVIVR